VLFLVVGSAFALEKLAGTGTPSWQALVVALCTVAAAGVTALHFSYVPTYLQRVSPAAATKLAYVEKSIPTGSEVVASQGIMGRFSIARPAYPYWALGAPERYPVSGRHPEVVFLLAPVQGTDEGYVGETRQAIHYVETRLHARVLEEGDGIWSFVWAPPPGVTSVVLP
jgi:hypothetical protein